MVFILSISVNAHSYEFNKVDVKINKVTTDKNDPEHVTVDTNLGWIELVPPISKLVTKKEFHTLAALLYTLTGKNASLIIFKEKDLSGVAGVLIGDKEYCAKVVYDYINKQSNNTTNNSNLKSNQDSTQPQKNNNSESSSQKQRKNEQMVCGYIKDIQEMPGQSYLLTIKEYTIRGGKSFFQKMKCQSF